MHPLTLHVYNYVEQNNSIVLFNVFVTVNKLHILYLYDILHAHMLAAFLRICDLSNASKCQVHEIIQFNPLSAEVARLRQDFVLHQIDCSS